MRKVLACVVMVLGVSPEVGSSTAAIVNGSDDTERPFAYRPPFGRSLEHHQS